MAHCFEGFIVLELRVLELKLLGLWAKSFMVELDLEFVVEAEVALVVAKIIQANLNRH